MRQIHEANSMPMRELIFSGVCGRYFSGVPHIFSCARAHIFDPAHSSHGKYEFMKCM